MNTWLKPSSSARPFPDLSMSSTSLYPPFLDIVPFTGKIQSEVVLPGSKSISNRALILAALSRGTVSLENMLFSRDTEIMMTALSALGFDVQPNREQLKVSITGQGGVIPVKEATLHIGNAGTAARFLTAFLALQKEGRYHMDGDEAMRRRPMAGLLEALEQQGAKFTFHGEAGHFPFTMETQGLKGGFLQVDASASSQILSALLMAGPFADSPLKIRLTDSTVSWPFVEITLRMLEEFQLARHTVESVDDFQHGGASYFVLNSLDQSPPPVYLIEPDITAASYFMVLPLLHGGWIRFPQLKGQAQTSIKQGDIQFADKLAELGVIVDWDHPSGLTLSLSPEHTPWKERSPANQWETLRNYDFNEFSDTFLTLAALAPLFPGPLTISGIEHTRKQETDRVHAMATELQRIGVNVEEQTDALRFAEILEKPFQVPQEQVSIHTYEDHRVAMSFAILGTWDAYGDQQPWLRILDPSCCRKTFPHFFDVLELTLKNSRIS